MVPFILWHLLHKYLCIYLPYEVWTLCYTQLWDGEEHWLLWDNMPQFVNMEAGTWVFKVLFSYCIQNAAPFACSYTSEGWKTLPSRRFLGKNYQFRIVVAINTLYLDHTRTDCGINSVDMIKRCRISVLAVCVQTFESHTERERNSGLLALCRWTHVMLLCFLEQWCVTS